MVALKFKKLRPEAILPAYATPGAAGMDVNYTPTDGVAATLISPGGRSILMTGLAVEIPLHFEIQVRPRSGLAAKHGLTVLNAPGTIDSDYRGEIGVVLINHGEETVIIQPGDRIAQLVLASVSQAQVMEIEGDLSTTGRGDGGFGSTGQ